MNNYKKYIQMLEDNSYLISMVPIEEILRFGYEIGLNENTLVLDLCCGYGTVLKVWNQAFGIRGIGVDRDYGYIATGKERLKKEGIKSIQLVCDDVTQYYDDGKYDVVICSETIEDIKSTIKLGEKFLKKDGTLAYQKLYSKVAVPPKELVDFDTEVLPLSELNSIFNDNGYRLISMASDTNGMWEHYVINWSGKRDIEQLAKDPDNVQLLDWIDKWYNIYFDHRREFEGQALFALKKCGGQYEI